MAASRNLKTISLALSLDGIELEVVRHHPQACVVGQAEHRFRHRAVPIAYFVHDAFDLGIGARLGDLSIDAESLVRVRNVAFVDAELDAEVDGGPPIVLEVLALQFANRLLEELGVHLEADRLDVAALLATKQVTGAADLEVERRDAEAAAERAELLDRREPLARHLRQRVHRRDQQVCIGTPIDRPTRPRSWYNCPRP